MNGDLAPVRGLVTVPDDEIVDHELEGDVALGLFDLWSLELHGSPDLSDDSGRSAAHLTVPIRVRVHGRGRRTSLAA
jgi:hypothetical protein